VFTRRQANGSAHALARAALSHASRSTFDVIPSCIATIIINEMQSFLVSKKNMFTPISLVCFSFMFRAVAVHEELIILKICLHVISQSIHIRLVK
jgi:hypothetical protein